MSIYNKCFYGEIWKIISKLSQNTLLICFTEYNVKNKHISLHMNHVMRKPVFLPYANNKDADQPAYPRSLTSTFVFAACIVQYL